MFLSRYHKTCRKVVNNIDVRNTDYFCRTTMSFINPCPMRSISAMIAVSFKTTSDAFFLSFLFYIWMVNGVFGEVPEMLTRCTGMEEYRSLTLNGLGVLNPGSQTPPILSPPKQS